MKALFKNGICFSLCFACLFAFGPLDRAWSAPRGRVVVAMGGDPTTLDHQMHAEIHANVVDNNIYDYLVKRIFKDGKIQHEPMLATSWETINDTTWVFRLRRGIKFHNDEEFNAEAVKFSIDRVLNPAQKAPRRQYFTFVDRVEVIDPYTVKIVTKTPIAFLLTNLGFGLTIIPPKYTKEKGDAYVGTHPVGTGPFKFVRWKKDEEIVLEANENYWGGPPNIKTLVFKPIPEDSTRMAALLSGDVDIIKNVPIHLTELVNKSGKARVMFTPGGTTVNIYFDMLKEGPLKDKRVRQAINYGVDKDAIIKHVFEGNARPVAGLLNPAHFGYDPNIKPYPYDPGKAKALLKEAGYAEGFSTILNHPQGRFEKDKEFAEAIAGQLTHVGINMKVQVLEWGSFMKKMYSPEGAGPTFTRGWAGTFDADGIYTPLLSCGAPMSRNCNKQLDGLLGQARSTLDPKKREQFYSQVGRFVYDEAPALFLFNLVDGYGVGHRVQDWKPTPDESFTLSLSGASLKD